MGIAELDEMEEAIRSKVIKGQKHYNSCRFEKAKKIWVSAKKLKAKVKALRYNLQIRV